MESNLNFTYMLKAGEPYQAGGLGSPQVTELSVTCDGVMIAT